MCLTAVLRGTFRPTIKQQLLLDVKDLKNNFILCTLYHVLLGQSNQERKMGSARRKHLRDGKHKILVEKTEGNGPFGRLELKWEENIKINPNQTSYSE
jgi:hypothetical protein